MSSLNEQEELVRSLGGILCSCSPEVNGHSRMPIAPAGVCPFCATEGPFYRAALERAQLNGRGMMNDLSYADIAGKYKPVEWNTAFREQPQEIDWLKEDFLEQGTLSSLFSKPGIGKSLIALELAVEVVRAGHVVMYVDDENRVSDTVDRLKAYRCTPDELDNLIMYSFAGLPALDTDDGGMHLEALAEANKPRLVIMDTVSRMVSGEENAANTFLQLYRCSLVPLKAKGITILRLDHSGKDDAKGMRGSSAKESDVDFVWRLGRTGEHLFSLECQKSRNGHVAFGQIINLERRYDPLHHIWDVQIEMPLDQFAGIIRQMDGLGIPPSYGRDRVRSILRENNISGMRNDQLQCAIIERRNRIRRSFVPHAETVPNQGTNNLEAPF